MKVTHHNANTGVTFVPNLYCGLRISSHVRAGSKKFYCQDNADMIIEAASECAEGDQDECELLPYLAQATVNSCT